jgi:hypothetical protein
LEFERCDSHFGRKGWPFKLKVRTLSQGSMAERRMANGRWGEECRQDCFLGLEDGCLCGAMSMLELIH